MSKETKDKRNKKRLNARISADLDDYVEEQRRGLRDRTAQIEFFIRYHRETQSKPIQK